MNPEEIASLTRHMEIEQAMASMKTIAQASWVFFESLIDAGFNEDDAIDMTQSLQFVMFSRPASPS